MISERNEIYEISLPNRRRKKAKVVEIRMHWERWLHDDDIKSIAKRFY